MQILNILLSEWDLFDKVNDKFFIRLGIDLLCMTILVRFVYFPIYKKKDFFFTFFLFNIIIFIVTFFLTKSDMSTGAAFGLFAVFSILRYRTENISTKDMTYLFLCIAIGLIGSVSKMSYPEQFFINSVMILVAFVLDGNLFLKSEMVKMIDYENIELIRPENKALLLEDLKKRTGLNVHDTELLKIDFVRDMAIMKIYYYEK